MKYRVTTTYIFHPMNDLVRELVAQAGAAVVKEMLKRRLYTGRSKWRPVDGAILRFETVRDGAFVPGQEMGIHRNLDGEILSRILAVHESVRLSCHEEIVEVKA